MPEILTTSAQPNYLSSEAFQADELELMVDRAERKVLGRYREHHRDSLILDAHFDNDIRLSGYVEANDGTIDLNESDDKLIDALRAAVAAIVEFWVDKPDEAEHIESKSQGSRSVSFRQRDLPSSVFSPLRPYDERRSWH